MPGSIVGSVAIFLMNRIMKAPTSHEILRADAGSDTAPFTPSGTLSNRLTSRLVSKTANIPAEAEQHLSENSTEKAKLCYCVF